jgi:parvulin-like peptidyl-prolyl isomerase
MIDARPPALVNGSPLYWDDLRPVLAEMAGSEALQEVILDRKVSEAIASRGAAITEESIAFERKLLLESLSDDPNHAIRLLDELRDRQNLGKHRFDALLKRNASLRLLVKDNVKVTDEAVRNMHELMHGPKRQARIMVLPDLEAAQAAINLVNSGVSFADVAVEVSIDSSAARGGLLEPISRVDPTYPESIRQTLWSLNPGEVSGPVLMDDRFAVLMLLKRVGGDSIRLEDARPALERMVRIQQERLLMDQLARRLVLDTQVTVFDDALQESWSRRKK